ncbi:hypothetical protein [Anseongella ginsenosidimutans]|nr:hypothetical protein [Anseongella ginsenosidimutans]
MIYFLLAFPAFFQGWQAPGFKGFFTELRAAAENRDVRKLETLIYPFKDKVEDMQEAMIENILHGNIGQRGDGAFSVRALDSLMANHLDKIKPIEKDLYGQLSKDIIFGKVIRSFKPKDVFVMDYRDARMILLQGKDGLQLFFWENLNNLLRN